MDNKLQIAGSLLAELGTVLKEAGDEQNNLLSQIAFLESEINREKEKRHKLISFVEEMVKELY